MKDYIKPALKTKPDKMIVHVGTNDLTKGIQNTTENLSDIVECARVLSPETQLYISAVCVYFGCLYTERHPLAFQESE